MRSKNERKEEDMDLDRRQLKTEAKQAMAGVRPRPYWVCLVYMIILTLLQMLSMRLDGSIEAYKQMFLGARMGVITYVEPVPVGGAMGWLLDVALQIMTAVVAVGFVIYTMRLWRHVHASVGSLFDGFGVFFRAVWIQLLPSLLIGLWSMIYAVPAAMLVAMTGQSWWLIAALPLMAPAIMASYSYRLATYVMLDRPELGCLRCVALSRDMMRGRRWELFKLDVSFLGWMLLCCIPVAGLFIAIWVYVYRQVTDAGYYEKVAGWAMPGWTAPAEPMG